MTENCITNGWKKPLSGVVPLLTVAAGAGISLVWWFGELCCSSSGGTPLDNRLEVLVTLNSCRVELSCLLPLVTIPWRATGCWGMSIFTAPTVNKPEFLSFWRFVTLEYNAWDLPEIYLILHNCSEMFTYIFTDCDLYDRLLIRCDTF